MSIATCLQVRTEKTTLSMPMESVERVVQQAEVLRVPGSALELVGVMEYQESFVPVFTDRSEIDITQVVAMESVILLRMDDQIIGLVIEEMKTMEEVEESVAEESLEYLHQLWRRTCDTTDGEGI